MKIICTTHADFMDTIYSCVTRGLKFDADYISFTITLTGGF